MSSATGLLDQWPEERPPLLWTVSGLGIGIASVSVAGGLILTTGYQEESEFAYAIDAESGAARWATRIGPTVRENSLMRWLSQRAPTVDGDRAYVSSAGGDLFCLSTKTGEVLWTKNYPSDATAHVGNHVYAFQTAGLPVCIEWSTGDLAAVRTDKTISMRSEETGDRHRLFHCTRPLRRAF